ncbi:MAG: ZIP family metal transporter [Legionellales bacterium]|nr:ZIP family metal transporter [Legionellales bacterium]
MLFFLAALIIFSITLIAGWYPLYRKKRDNHHPELPFAEAFAAGVFLGAGLIHMLSDAQSDFTQLGAHYPWAFLISGITFLFLLWLEHLGQEYYEHLGSNSNHFALLATGLLCFHALFLGAALGLALDTSMFILILIAILGHKWAESFSLAVQISKSQFSSRSCNYLFLFFSLMTPLGILIGQVISHSHSYLSALSPIVNAISAGTFIYLGTLHGLERATMISRCCNLKQFSLTIFGFMLMALIAVWT